MAADRPCQMRARLVDVLQRPIELSANDLAGIWFIRNSQWFDSLHQLGNGRSG